MGLGEHLSIFLILELILYFVRDQWTRIQILCNSVIYICHVMLPCFHIFCVCHHCSYSTLDRDETIPDSLPLLPCSGTSYKFSVHLFAAWSCVVVHLLPLLPCSRNTYLWILWWLFLSCYHMLYSLWLSLLVMYIYIVALQCKDCGLKWKAYYLRLINSSKNAQQ